MGKSYEINSTNKIKDKLAKQQVRKLQIRRPI